MRAKVSCNLFLAPSMKTIGRRGKLLDTSSRIICTPANVHCHLQKQSNKTQCLIRRRRCGGHLISDCNDILPPQPIDAFIPDPNGQALESSIARLPSPLTERLVLRASIVNPDCSANCAGCRSGSTRTATQAAQPIFVTLLELRRAKLDAEFSGYTPMSELVPGAAMSVAVHSDPRVLAANSISRSWASPVVAVCTVRCWQFIDCFTINVRALPAG